MNRATNFAAARCGVVLGAGLMAVAQQDRPVRQCLNSVMTYESVEDFKTNNGWLRLDGWTALDFEVGAGNIWVV